MPDCPKCHEMLGLGVEGGLCPKCLTIYKWEAVKRMPGYDAEWVEDAWVVYKVLRANGSLKRGITQVEFTYEGLLLTYLEDLP